VCTTYPSSLVPNPSPFALGAPFYTRAAKEILIVYQNISSKTPQITHFSHFERSISHDAISPQKNVPFRQMFKEPVFVLFERAVR
jgi:hypothetical protein